MPLTFTVVPLVIQFTSSDQILTRFPIMCNLKSDYEFNLKPRFLLKDLLLRFFLNTFYSFELETELNFLCRFLNPAVGPFFI